MAIKEDLEVYVSNTFKAAWTRRDGQKVPVETDVGLGNVGVNLDAVCLYADMAKSTQLVDNYDPEFAAEIYKTFLYCASKLIRHHDGEITAFDGDRVMGVFIGGAKNSNAAKCALRINYAVQRIINPAIKVQYPSSDYQVTHAVGIDSSPLLVSRIGYRGNNDLIWMGKAGNYAAKLCAFRDGNFTSWITDAVYKSLSDEAKFSNGVNMWEARNWTDKNITVYRSSYHWAPPGAKRGA